MMYLLASSAEGFYVGFGGSGDAGDAFLVHAGDEGYGECGLAGYEYGGVVFMGRQEIEALCYVFHGDLQHLLFFPQWIHCGKGKILNYAVHCCRILTLPRRPFTGGMIRQIY